MSYNPDFSTEQIILDNMRLVHYLAKGVNSSKKRKYEYDDIAQEGAIGLIKAAETYNGMTKFSTYSSRCIINEIYIYFRKNDKHIDVLSLSDTVLKNNEENEKVLEDITYDKKAIFTSRIENLNTIEKCLSVILNTFSYTDMVIVIYSAIGKGQTFIAESLGISQSYVSRKGKNLIANMKKHIEKSLEYEEKICVDMSTDGCIISFTEKTVDKKVVGDMLKNTELKDSFKITRNNNKVLLTIYEIEELLDVIALFVGKMWEYSNDK